LNVVVWFGDVVWLQEPIEVVVGFGIIFRARIAKKELCGGLAGFFFECIGIARDEDQSIIAGHGDTSTLMSKLTRCS
jgi:hypothetical protein